MNLYKIKFSHHAPKDSIFGIKALLLAETDIQVYKWIASEPETNEGRIFNEWKQREDYSWDEERGTFIDKDGDEVDEGWWDEDDEPENFKWRMIRLKGEIDDDIVDFSGVYYGVTLFGWELLKENVTTDYSELIDLGIVFQYDLLNT